MSYFKISNYSMIWRQRIDHGSIKAACLHAQLSSVMLLLLRENTLHRVGTRTILFHVSPASTG